MPANTPGKPPSPRPRPPRDRPRSAPSPNRTRTSPLAVASLACSLVLCCPLTSLAAMALGAMATRSIALSGGRLAGMRLVRWALLISAMSLLLQCALLGRFQVTYETRLREGVAARANAALEAIDAGEIDVLAEQWALGPDGELPFDGAAAEEFRAASARRWGAFERFEVTNLTLEDSPLGGPWWYEVGGLFVFEDGQAFGEVRVRAAPSPFGFFPVPRIAGFVIDDAQGEPVRFPPAAEAEPTSDAPPTPTEEGAD